MNIIIICTTGYAMWLNTICFQVICEIPNLEYRHFCIECSDPVEFKRKRIQDIVFNGSSSCLHLNASSITNIMTTDKTSFYCTKKVLNISEYMVIEATASYNVTNSFNNSQESEKLQSTATTKQSLMLVATTTALHEDKTTESFKEILINQKFPLWGILLIIFSMLVVIGIGFAFAVVFIRSSKQQSMRNFSQSETEMQSNKVSNKLIYENKMHEL